MRSVCSFSEVAGYHDTGEHPHSAAVPARWRTVIMVPFSQCASTSTKPYIFLVAEQHLPVCSKELKVLDIFGTWRLCGQTKWENKVISVIAY